ncbi:MAG: DUF885 domain-containing protein [Myxococcales bacterium]
MDAPRFRAPPVAGKARSSSRFLVLAALLSCSHAAAPPSEPPRSDIIERSNANAQVLLAVQAKFFPEQASRAGIAGLDDRITDLTPGHEERYRQADREALAELRARLDRERDPLVAQDLRILIHAAELQIRGSELSEQYEVPYLNPARIVFASMNALLDDQVEASRRPAAIVRLRKYTGLEPGTQPIAKLAAEETRRGLANPKLRAPARLEVENDLKTEKFLVDGVEKLFRKYDVAGANEPLTALQAQIAEHARFVREELLPRASEDFRLPPPLYAFALERVGVDIPPAQLAATAHQSFAAIQKEMEPIAAELAKARGDPSSDYRDVIRGLKKQQIPDDQVLRHYRDRLAQIEEIIRANKLVTLPSRPARIRLGTPAENAQQPAPHMQPPRLIGNKGEQGEFVLPLDNPAADSAQKYDDFNFPAASWTLTAHEARPGHELQFATMVERGVPLARAIFAFNSVNVEGWGLYAEAITLPYMPPEGKLVSLQLRLQRAARAFLDPELQAGKWTPVSAREFLEREVGLSHAFAQSEVDRYTFRAPAQATSYFFGYLKLTELRREAESRLGARFSAQRFHDAILAQGLLPPDLLREAVLEAVATY